MRTFMGLVAVTVLVISTSANARIFNCAYFIDDNSGNTNNGTFGIDIPTATDESAARHIGQVGQYNITATFYNPDAPDVWKDFVMQFDHTVDRATYLVTATSLSKDGNILAFQDLTTGAFIAMQCALPGRNVSSDLAGHLRR